MRSFLFNVAYWIVSILYTLMAAFAALAPGRKATGWIIRRYVKRMVWAMRVFAGIRLQVRGRERLPEGAFIIAAKHQSWGDGFCVYSQFDDLAFVTGNHLERFPLLGTVLQKLGAIVVDNCGGPEARRALAESAAQAPATTKGRATQRRSPMCRQIGAAGPLASAARKPRVNRNCQASGLKNQRPSTGQVGMLTPNQSASA